MGIIAYGVYYVTIPYLRNSASVILAIIVIFNHRENIKRLRNGEENRFTKKKANKVDKSVNNEDKKEEEDN